jgi:hypothetical protein
MNPVAQSELDTLAQALARLLATWWQVHAMTAMQSRAPPITHPGQANSQVHSQTINALEAGKMTGNSNASVDNEADVSTQH